MTTNLFSPNTIRIRIRKKGREGKGRDRSGSVTEGYMEPDCRSPAASGAQESNFGLITAVCMYLSDQKGRQSMAWHGRQIELYFAIRALPTLA